MADIYPPSEDSFLLAEFVKKSVSENPPKNMLDMGSGSGIQAKTAIESGISPETVTLADINPVAVSHLKLEFPRSTIIHSNLFGNIGNSKFELITFNPPYLPEDRMDSGIDTTGGEQGNEIVNLFLEEARNHLTEGGKILLLTSSLTGRINWLDYRKKLMGKKKIFFEELYVWELENNTI